MSRPAKIKSQQKHQVLQALNRLGSPVTVFDVAAATGLPVARASWWLNQIAAQTNAHMAVTCDGALVYLFPDNVSESKLSWMQQTRDEVQRFCTHLLEYIGRFYVGTMLLCSPLCLSIFWTLLVVTVSGTISKRRDEVFSGDTITIIALLLHPFLSIFKWNYNYRGKSFSNDLLRFFLGGTNPNRRLSNRRWKAVGELIRANNGVLIREQLSPYINDNFPGGDENSVIPVLVHFNGVPSVTKSGNIVYLFPDMQTSTRDREKRDCYPIADKLLEKTWYLGSLPANRLSFVVTFTGLNLLGYLGLYEQTYLVTPMSPLAPLIWGYFAFGLCLVTLPIMRALILARKNDAIRKRNEQKTIAAQRIKNPDIDLRRRLSEAKELAFAWRNTLKQQAAYSTMKDYLEQANATEPQWLTLEAQYYQKSLEAKQMHKAEQMHKTEPSHDRPKTNVVNIDFSAMPPSYKAA